MKVYLDWFHAEVPSRVSKAFPTLFSNARYNRLSSKGPPIVLRRFCEQKAKVRHSHLNNLSIAAPAFPLAIPQGTTLKRTAQKSTTDPARPFRTPTPSQITETQGPGALPCAKSGNGTFDAGTWMNQPTRPAAIQTVQHLRLTSPKVFEHHANTRPRTPPRKIVVKERWRQGTRRHGSPRQGGSLRSWAPGRGSWFSAKSEI